MYPLAIQSYVPSIHSEHVARWMKYRDMNPKGVDNLPHIGWIVFREHDPSTGVAAGFLRHCEGNYGLIDGYITNPTCLSTERNQALDMITESIVHTSKTHGISKVLAFTTDDCIITRAKQHGFASLPHTFLVYERGI